MGEGVSAKGSGAELGSLDFLLLRERLRMIDDGEVGLGLIGNTEAKGASPDLAGLGFLVRQLGNFFGLPLFLLTPRGLERTSWSTLMVPVL